MNLFLTLFSVVFATTTTVSTSGTTQVNNDPLGSSSGSTLYSNSTSTSSTSAVVYVGSVIGGVILIGAIVIYKYTHYQKKKTESKEPNFTYDGKGAPILDMINGPMTVVDSNIDLNSPSYNNATVQEEEKGLVFKSPEATFFERTVTRFQDNFKFTNTLSKTHEEDFSDTIFNDKV